MAIHARKHLDSDSESGGSEGPATALPRKASFSQLLSRYLSMGFLSCFGVGPEERPKSAAAPDMRTGSLTRVASTPLEVPQDEFASGKSEPYAQIVESYGPKNSVPASFRTSFLGADFDNEFSLTNGVKWQVWQEPGELSPEAVAHFESQSGKGATESPQAERASPFSEAIAGPARSGGESSDAAFTLPLGQTWEGCRESPEGRGGVVGSSQGGTGRTAGFKGRQENMGRRGEALQKDSWESAPEDDGLDTADGAALLSKLGAPHTIPLTPEIVEELQLSGSSQSQDPALLTRDFSIGSAVSVPESEAAGHHSELDTDHLFPPNSSLSAHRTRREGSSRPDLPRQNSLQGERPFLPPRLAKSQSALGHRSSPDRLDQPQRTLSLRSEGSLKIVKETHHIEEGENIDGRKTVNQYVKLRRLGTGSYGKVVLHKDSVTDKLYAMKILHRSRLMHMHISGEETAWTDVLREIAIMKQLDHPNLVSLQEVIDDPDNDKIYMVLEYEEKGPVFEGTGPEGGLGEDQARAYIRDALAGLQYLHFQNIVHGDIKPDNLLMSAEGRLKIGDFGVSHIFENDNDQLRRTPGTPAFTAPECCLGVPYHGKPADMWALGCTLYVFVTGRYPFMIESHALEDLYQAILHQEVDIPGHLHPDLQDLLRKLLEKDPEKRITVEEAARHPWLTQGLGPLSQVELKAIDVNADHMSAALTQLDDDSKARLARLFARHAAAVRRSKAGASQNTSDKELETLSRSSYLSGADAYDSDFSAPSSRYGSPRRERESARPPTRTGSSRFADI